MRFETGHVIRDELVPYKSSTSISESTPPVNHDTKHTNAQTGSQPDSANLTAIEALTQILKAAIEQEVASFIDRHAHLVDENGHKLVVRNGTLPEQESLTGFDAVAAQQP